jgi:tetratricopeptide (TPR) repeat protein
VEARRVMARSRSTVAALLALSLSAAGCGSAPEPEAGVEATSLLGRPLVAPPLSPDARARLESELADARTRWEQAPDDADATIWLGRRTAYLGRYREAIEIFSRGLARHPDDVRFYRHRGHRYITIRNFDAAIADLERGASLIEGQPDEVEPDGQPNARGIPTSTLHSNVWYHLALARYLAGDFEGASDGWNRARAATGNPDNLVAASNWLYLSLRRAGRDAEAAAVLAPVRADLDVIENGSYHQLLLLYRGERTVEDLLGAATGGASGSAVSYGVGAWLLVEGREDDARAIWARMVEEPDWPSFGHIAAEAELARR